MSFYKEILKLVERRMIINIKKRAWIYPLILKSYLGPEPFKSGGPHNIQYGLSPTIFRTIHTIIIT